MKCIELYVPKWDNAGKAIAHDRWVTLEGTLRQRFDGFSTYTVAGQWTNDQGQTHLDRVVIYRIICLGTPEELKTIKTLADFIKGYWHQESVLYTVADIDATFVT